MHALTYEEMVKELEASGRYRILRRLETRFEVLDAPTRQHRRGLFVDVETTGLDSVRDEIIELAIVPFTYSLEGDLIAVGEPYHRLRQPSCPIPAEVTALTGLDDAKVAGHVIDPDDVAQVVAPAALVIAHNAGFDRRFLERLCPSFSTKAWACSLSQVDWSAEGFGGQKLVYLATALGVFYDQHRAVDDCLAALRILSEPLPVSGATGLRQLLAAARQPSWRIWAENSPFELKDALKARGYRWNSEHAAGPRAWYIDVPEALKDAEVAYLCAEIYGGEVELTLKRLDAYDRFSNRV